MADEQEQQLYEATEADKLLNHPLLQRFFDDCEQESKNLWWQAKPEDFNSEHFKYAMHQKEAIKDLKQYLVLCLVKGREVAEFLKLRKDGTLEEM